MTKVEQIKFAVNQFIEKVNLDVVDSIFSTDYIAHAENREYKGHDFLKKISKQIRSAIPDVRVSNVEILSEEGDIITWQRTLEGTHEANMMGIPASKKKLNWNEMVVSRFEGDKIIEEWVVSESAGQLLLNQPRKK